MPPVDPAILRPLLSGRVWGAEIDTRFRVLALTVEPASEDHPDAAPADPRLQVLLYPVSAVAASLVEDVEDGPVVRQFEEDRLADVVAMFDGARPDGDPLPGRPADLDAVAPRLSMRGQATTGDGFRHHLHLRLEAGDLTLELWASFDEVLVRGPDEWGAALPTTEG